MLPSALSKSTHSVASASKVLYDFSPSASSSLQLALRREASSIGFLSHLGVFVGKLDKLPSWLDSSFCACPSTSPAVRHKGLAHGARSAAKFGHCDAAGPRGYLWVGTFGGLARFDGERFTVFDSADMPPLGNNGILSLYESRSGVLWIGTLDGGLIRLDNGVVTTYTEARRLAKQIRHLHPRGCRREALDQYLRRGSHILSARSRRPTPLTAEKRSENFFCRRGTEACGSALVQDVVRFGADGSIATLNCPKPTVFLVHEARDGSVWIAFRDQYRLVRYHQGVFSDVPLTAD